MSFEANQKIQKHIIDKLLQWDRVEAFRGPVIAAQSDLRRGLLLNLREVEIKLVADGRVSHGDQNYIDSIY